MKRALLAVCLAAIASGCSFVPQRHVYLDQAEAAYREAEADRDCARLAAEELKAAATVLASARSARDTLQDAAVVDHLAYLARQRTAIAREVARQRVATSVVRPS